MKISKLSLKKVNNIDRQIVDLKYKSINVDDKNPSCKHLIYNTDEQSVFLRDFYEYYIDDQPLINIISKLYWNTETNEMSDFFNTHIGCLGGFGLFWDKINVSILIDEKFTQDQYDKLVEIFNSKKNYTSSDAEKSKVSIEKEIVANVRNEFMLYCCQDCGDSNCGGITLSIKFENNNVIWTDNENIEIYFDLKQYRQVFRDFLRNRELETN